MHGPFSHQIVLCVCMSMFVCCVCVEMDKTLLAKAGIIVLISSSDFNSFLIHGKNPHFLWRISLLPCTYVFFS